MTLFPAFCLSFCRSVPDRVAQSPAHWLHGARRHARQTASRPHVTAPSHYKEVCSVVLLVVLLVVVVVVVVLLLLLLLLAHHWTRLGSSHSLPSGFWRQHHHLTQ